MLVLRCEGEVFYIHCNILGMDVSEIPKIRAHASGYELDVSHVGRDTVRHYVRSVCAIAHGIDPSKWVRPEDDWGDQLDAVTRLGNLIVFWYDTWGIAYDGIGVSTLVSCVDVIHNHLWLHWSDELGDEENATKITAVENAFRAWDVVTYYSDFKPGSCYCSVIRGALIDKVAHTCPLAVFQDSRKELQFDGFATAIIGEMEDQIRAMDSD